MELTTELKAKLGLKGAESEQEIWDAVVSKLSDVPVKFQARCTEDYVDETPIWSQGEEYCVEYNRGYFLADSEINSYGGTYLDKDCFFNFFEVADTTEEIARYMCEEGYGDMFVQFLNPETDRDLIDSIQGDLEMMI